MEEEAGKSATGSDRDGIPFDPVIEAYKRGIDRTLLRENLKLTVEERFLKLQALQRLATELHQAGRRAGP